MEIARKQVHVVLVSVLTPATVPAGIMRYGAMYWTPLIVYAIQNGEHVRDKHAPDEASRGASALLFPMQSVKELLPVRFLNSYCVC